MAFPPAPESTKRQVPIPSRSIGTSQLAMRLYRHDSEADDSSVVSDSSFVKAARESLERKILEGKQGEDNGGGGGGKSLARISERRESCNSSCASSTSSSSSSSSSLISKVRSSMSSSRSSTSAAIKRFEADKVVEANKYETDGDDDAATVTESILDSANEVLSSIGSSPYYAGRSKKTSTTTYESLTTPPNPTQPSPMKQRTTKHNTSETENYYSKNTYNTEKESISPEKTSNGFGDQLKASSKFAGSYFADENTKPSDDCSILSGGGRTTASSSSYKSDIMKKYEELRELKSSPMRSRAIKHDTNDAANYYSRKVYNIENEPVSLKNTINDRDDRQLKVSSSSISSYSNDENVKPSDDRSIHSKNSISATSMSSYRSSSIATNNEALMQLESESRHLQLLLEKKQLETKKAKQFLATSMRKAYELLRKYDAEL